MWPENSKPVVCVRNTGYEASLELQKIYISLSDPHVESTGHLRVVDESGEDYLFPTDCFAPLSPALGSAIDAA